MLSFKINYSLTFSEQVLLILAKDAEGFVKNHARFNSNWIIKSDKTLGFTVSDYRIQTDESSKIVICLSRLSFLGLHSPLPWSFINEQSETVEDCHHDWLDLINKRFWELDFLAKTAQSDLRFLSLSKRNSDNVGGMVRLVKNGNENISALSVKDELKKILGDFTLCTESLIPLSLKIKISESNLSYLSKDTRIGKRCALGGYTRMQNGYSMTIDVLEGNLIRENYEKVMDSKHLLSLLFVLGLNTKRVIPMRNKLVIRFNGQLQDKVLGSKSCCLGRFSHIGTSKMLEIKVAV